MAWGKRLATSLRKFIDAATGSLADACRSALDSSTTLPSSALCGRARRGGCAGWCAEAWAMAGRTTGATKITPVAARYRCLPPQEPQPRVKPRLGDCSGDVRPRHGPGVGTKE